MSLTARNRKELMAKITAQHQPVGVCLLCGLRCEDAKAVCNHAGSHHNKVIVRYPQFNSDIFISNNLSIYVCRSCNYISCPDPKARKTVFREVIRHYKDCNSKQPAALHFKVTPGWLLSKQMLCAAILTPRLWRTSPHTRQGQIAKTICLSCSYRLECLATALKSKTKSSIWGGVYFGSSAEIASINLNELRDYFPHDCDYNQEIELSFIGVDDTSITQTERSII
jgi:hypothetical protein